MKKLTIILSCLLIVCTLFGFAPLSSTYIDVTTTQLGEVRIYLPSSAQMSLSDGLPVNITSSNITGYILDSSGERQYQVTIAPYGETWEYRLYSGSWGDNNNLTVTAVDVDSSTLAFAGASYRFSADTIFYLGLLLLVVCVPFVVWRSGK